MKQLSCTFLLILLTGCMSSENYFYRASLEPSKVGNNFTNTTVNGMSESDIRKIYGQPYKIHRNSDISSNQNLVYVYFYRGPNGDGHYIAKELVIVFQNLVVVNHSFNERIHFRHEAESRSSNHFIQLD